jgi:putative SOS response-associated peptidase YedK
MCGRFRLTRASKLAERFGIEPEDDWVPRYNIAPTQNVEVIRQHADTNPSVSVLRCAGG